MLYKDTCTSAVPDAFEVLAERRDEQLRPRQIINRQRRNQTSYENAVIPAEIMEDHNDKKP